MIQPVPEDVLHDYGGMCWWCGGAADSREHRYKRTDVVQSFGKGPWRGSVVRVRSDSAFMDHIQGPGSDKLKFSKVLCARCNDTRSQPFDRAYDGFAEYLRSHETAIVESASLRLSDVYGSFWEQRAKEVTKFFLKNICCRLAEAMAPIPRRIIQYLDDDHQSLSDIQLEMTINLAAYEFHKHERECHGRDDGSLWSGPQLCEFSASRRVFERISGHLGFRCFFLGYECTFDQRSGYSNFLSRDLINLPQYWPNGLAPGDIARKCDECHPGQADT
jgi:hypothetical protein